MRRIVSIVVVVVLALGSVLSMAGVAMAADGKITGHVYVEGTTTPIPSTTVYAYDWDADLGLGQVIPAGTGFTDENGSYTISGLADGTYRLKAEADRYFSQYYNGDTTPGSAQEVSVDDPNTTSGIDFALGEGGSLSGSVHQADGTTPIIGARVIAYDSADQMVDDAWTSENGTYTVGNNMDPGSYKVKAEADGYLSEYYDNATDSTSATPVTVTLSTDTPGVNFTLAEGGSISGTVHTDNGTPIYGAHVMAYDSADQMVDDAWTSDNGSYTVGNNILPGGYKVSVDADGFFSDSADPVTITGTSKITGIDFVLAAGASIKGSVLEEGGTAPIYGARIMAFDNVTSELMDEAWSRADGSYVLGNNIDLGSYILQAEADGYFSKYYDNVTDIALAQPVLVAGPDEITGKNFTLSAQTLVFSFVNASDIGENTATITWTTDQPGTSQVEYGITVQYGSSTTLDTDLVTSHTVNLTGLTRATTYHYRVKSKDGLGRESHSADFNFTTPHTTKPVISDVAATDITATGANITWTTDELATSQMEYGLTASLGTTTDEDATLVTSHTMVLTGLASGTTYHYMVKSRDTQGSGLWTLSNVYTFTTLDVTPPAISAVTASGMTQTGATITWTTNEAATSQVEYGLTSQYGSATTLDATLATSHSVSLTGLTAGTTYHYRVKSKDASNNEAVSADLTFATVAAPVPDTTPPTTPVVSDGGESTTNLTQLHATWTSSDAESGVAEYQYAIGTSAGDTDLVNWTSAGTGTSLTRTGLNLSVGSTYYFSVKAKNGEGLWSAVGSSNGILVAEEETPVEPSEDGGMPTWVWIVIGLGAAAAIGGIGFWLIKGMPKQPQQ
ncbi:MAG: hypothetical protein FJ020_05500 [Chloroflexi bacterium]|nr:hypothetical protein [Chloroflexota bacterium]